MNLLHRLKRKIWSSIKSRVSLLKAEMQLVEASAIYRQPSPTNAPIGTLQTHMHLQYRQPSHASGARLVQLPGGEWELVSELGKSIKGVSDENSSA